MTSATLFREGTDLDVLLAELDEQFPGQVRVLEVSHVREGGVLGFFARPRVAVQYTIEDTTGPAPATGTHADPIDALIAAAEMVETGQSHGGVIDEVLDGGAGEPGNVEFARMLLDIAARKAAERGIELPAASGSITPEVPAKVAQAVEAAELTKRAEQLAQAEALVRTRAETAATGFAQAEFSAVETPAATSAEATGTKAAAQPKSVRVRTPRATPAARTTKATEAVEEEQVGSTADPAGRQRAVRVRTPLAGKPGKAPRARKAAAETSAEASIEAAAQPITEPITEAVAQPSDEPITETPHASRDTAVVAASGAAETRAAEARAAETRAAETGAADPARTLSIADLHEPDERLVLRRRLAELGVPFDRIPTDAPHRYAAVEQLVARLPEVGPLPTAGNAIVVVAGAAGPAARAAGVLAERMGLPSDRIWTFRCPGAGSLDHRLIELSDATALARTVRKRRPTSPQPPTLVVVCTDETDDTVYDGPTAPSILAALAPDTLWLHVDATRKASDTAALVREAGTPAALVVTGAARTASPASVWELDVPIALLDGRPATRSAWAVLLLEKLTETAE